MTDRFCIRGCIRRGVHYASCKFHGAEYEGAFPCEGCAPREARDRALVCDRCYYRLRSLVRDSSDLVGRLRSLADPTKATPTDQLRSGSTSTEPPAPVDADLLDAIIDVTHTLRGWDEFLAPATLEQSLDDLVNDVQHVELLSTGFLQRNDAVDGIRASWSVADAMAKWGVERRTKNEPEWSADEAREEVNPIPEWGDALLNREESEALISAGTLRRWVQKDLITPVGTIYIAGRRTTLFRRSELLNVQAEQKRKQHAGRPRATKSEGEQRQ